MATIRDEIPADRVAIREVHRLAFGGEDEGRLVDALRAGGFGRAALVAEVDGRIVGHVLLSSLVIDTEDGPLEALSLAPLAVVPDHQGRGIGSRLVSEGLRQAAEQGHRIVIVVGEPGYYGRFGFSAEAARPLQSAYAGEYFQALALVPGALDGVAGSVRYAPPFEALAGES